MMIDWASLLGFVIGACLLVGVMQVAQVPLATLAHPAGWLMVLGGTLTAVLLSFSTTVLARAFSRAAGSFITTDRSLEGPIDTLVEVAQYVRKHGLLAIAPLIREFQQQEPLLYRGLSQIIDNTPAQQVQDTLATELDMSYRAAQEEVRVFEAAAGFAPTMGLIGALLGLMHTLSHLAEPAILGQGVAGAFSATLLGLVLANLVLLPLVTRLKTQAQQDWLRGSVVLQGLASLQANEHPIVMREKLTAFISESTGLASSQTTLRSRQQSAYPADLQEGPWLAQNLQGSDPAGSLNLAASLSGRH